MIKKNNNIIHMGINEKFYEKFCFFIRKEGYRTISSFFLNLLRKEKNFSILNANKIKKQKPKNKKIYIRFKNNEINIIQQKTSQQQNIKDFILGYIEQVCLTNKLL